MSVSRKTWLLSTAAAMVCGICLALPSGSTRAAGQGSENQVTQARLLNADQEQGNWILHHKDYSAHRFSSLDQINRDNVKNLKVAWTMALGGVEGGGIWTHGGLEGTPIAENGFLYVTDGWGSVYKIDAHGGRGKLVWKMDPKTDHDWAGAVACCGVDNRGVALWDNMVISHSLDGRLIATNKDTGQIAWQRQIADPDKSEVITAAPLIVKDMAITGVAGAEYGIRGWLAATDLKTQKEVWRTHTIPAKGEPGSDTWKDDYNAAASGGGSTWVTGSYDSATNTIVWGVANPGPDWDNAYRPGDNLYTDSSIGLDADTGKIKWHFQHTPNDPYDYDSVSENVLVDATVEGKPQKLSLEADRNGFGYAVDRSNGNFVWAVPFVKKVT
ncbi:MAG: PQQ-binding-like beta-propeller repeat protein, partial [Acetobacteraceae bacterium]|nr:PQQ-binding-like beta-propeller repeat protein [Acetobacteraceae bacterium]